MNAEELLVNIVNILYTERSTAVSVRICSDSADLSAASMIDSGRSRSKKRIKKSDKKRRTGAGHVAGHDVNLPKIAWIHFLFGRENKTPQNMHHFLEADTLVTLVCKCIEMHTVPIL